MCIVFSGPIWFILFAGVLVCVVYCTENKMLYYLVHAVCILVLLRNICNNTVVMKDSHHALTGYISGHVYLLISTIIIILMISS